MNSDPPRGRPGETTRASLLESVAGSPGSPRWSEFDARYRGMILGMARAEGITPAEAEDLTQEVLVKLVRHLAGFRHRGRPGAFRKFLRTAVGWEAATRRRRSRREAAEPLGEPSRDPDRPDPKLPTVPPAGDQPTEEVCEQAWLAALEALRKQLSARDLQLLDLYYRQGWPAHRVGPALAPPLKPGAVHQQARRLRGILADELRRQLG